MHFRLDEDLLEVVYKYLLLAFDFDIVEDDKPDIKKSKDAAEKETPTTESPEARALRIENLIMSQANTIPIKKGNKKDVEKIKIILSCLAGIFKNIHLHR